ncbi:hypothetical protein [Christiangramia sp. SM2212]|uniref:Uncharacterized protein n=1 Tax=Christiangramia sediminicola TaxID=3073267 RepID=A0ABU1ERS2_9FLAO|nr:hypothetical protein [Christiangramia sp. SM2212]MDR5591093.1 hypothetical protein [Christiangramia sp. SM2212]
MQNTLKIIVSFFLIGIVGCGKEDVEPPESPYLGYYKVISFTSDVAIDINQDGVAEYDFVKELDKAWFENDMNMMGEHHISIRSSSHGADVLWVRSNGMPFDSYRPNLPYLFMRFGPEGTAKYLTIEDGQVVSFETQEAPTDIDRPEYAEAFPRYTSFQFLDANTLETKMNQKFYDEEKEVWKDVSLIAVLSKITDPDYIPVNY